MNKEFKQNKRFYTLSLKKGIDSYTIAGYIVTLLEENYSEMKIYDTLLRKVIKDNNLKSDNNFYIENYYLGMEEEVDYDYLIDKRVNINE